MAEAMEDKKIRKGPCTSEENSLLTSYIVLYDNGRYDFVAKDAGRMVENTRKGPWTLEEDSLLTSYISLYGKGRWDLLAKAAGLNRSGSSCRLRWVNYLCPHLKHTDFTPEEERLIIELHARWGNRWSRIAHFLPGRTDNAIKNFFRTRIKKKNHPLERSDCNIRNGRPKQVQCLSRSSSSPTSFRTPVFLEDNDEMSSTSLPRQSTEDGQVTYINSMKQEYPDTWNVVEGHSTDFPFSFSVQCLNSMSLPELYGEDKQSCSLYNTASSMSFANTEFYSDELWNIDER